jgi:hypothetical protein
MGCKLYFCVCAGTLGMCNVRMCNVHDQCWRLGLHVPACCPEARPMLEAGASYARLLPRGQTNAGGWDFTAQRPDQCWRLGLHCPEARPMLEAGTSYARLLPSGQTNAGGWDFICSLAAQRPDQCWRLGLHCPEARPMLEAGTSLPEARPMLEAGTSYARLLPRGKRSNTKQSEALNMYIIIR